MMSSRRPSNKTVLAAGAIIGVFIAASAVLGYHASGNPRFCMSCHSMEQVGKHWQLQRAAGQTVARAHEVIGKAGAIAKADQKQLDQARELVRKVQWFWDMVAAENSMGFHNPDQVLNTLGRSIDMAPRAIAAANRAAGTQF